ncbi:MAG: archease [Candidatus Eisenbacteria bacterium]|uniref:Archease n=1 Tax=Eiseniibacteriota bacterium TaxID=2212470 RepID=A0A938BNU1_UNCEI|nr:archease [Candidatus Eisenbacteria bacterium]
MERAGFEAIDHTADVGLKVWAADLEELFLQAARGLASLLTDPEGVTRDREVDVGVSGADPEELLVAWLEEVLYLFEARGLLLVDFERPRITGPTAEAKGGVKGGVEGDAEYRLTCRARGTAWNRGRHPLRSALKAATYHGLRLAPDAKGRYQTTIVFDT